MFLYVFRCFLWHWLNIFVVTCSKASPKKSISQLPKTQVKCAMHHFLPFSNATRCEVPHDQIDQSPWRDLLDREWWPRWGPVCCDSRRNAEETGTLPWWFFQEYPILVTFVFESMIYFVKPMKNGSDWKILGCNQILGSQDELLKQRIDSLSLGSQDTVAYEQMMGWESYILQTADNEGHISCLRHPAIQQCFLAFASLLRCCLLQGWVGFQNLGVPSVGSREDTRISLSCKWKLFCCLWSDGFLFTLNSV